MDHLLSEAINTNFNKVQQHDAVIMDDKFLSGANGFERDGAAFLIEKHADRLGVELFHLADFPDRIIFGI